MDTAGLGEVSSCRLVGLRFRVIGPGGSSRLDGVGETRLGSGVDAVGRVSGGAGFSVTGVSVTSVRAVCSEISAVLRASSLSLRCRSSKVSERTAGRRFVVSGGAYRARGWMAGAWTGRGPGSGLRDDLGPQAVYRIPARPHTIISTPNGFPPRGVLWVLAGVRFFCEARFGTVAFLSSSLTDHHTMELSDVRWLWHSVHGSVHGIRIAVSMCGRQGSFGPSATGFWSKPCKLPVIPHATARAFAYNI